jgi:ParB family chromosome partitioning protein
MSDTATPRSFRRRGLGRGLEALLSATPADEDEPILLSVDPASVKPNPEQPRRDFDEPGIDALAESIRAHGLLHPIVVQRRNGGFELVAGERRLRAAQRAGVATIPAIVRPAAETARQSLELALTENLMRTDLNPIEEAAAYARLADTFGLSHEAIGLRLGRGRPTISNAIRLLGLAAPVQKAVAEGRLTVGHAKWLLGISDPTEQEQLARNVEERGLTVRDTEQLVQRRLDARAAEHEARTGRRSQTGRPSPDDEALQRGFERALGMPVQLMRRRRGGGHLIIEFTDDEDLDTLYQRLQGPPL